MATTTTRQIWQQQQLNSSGIRRLKIVDARTIELLPVGIGTNKVSLLPIGDVVLYEFIFPSDLSCVASSALARKESGSAYWVHNVSFTLPHAQDLVLKWVHENAQVQWLAILEDYNGATRLLGSSPRGLDWTFQANTGAAPKDANPQAFSFSGEQLYPYLEIAGYEDFSLFPTAPGYTYGFSLAFEA